MNELQECVHYYYTILQQMWSQRVPVCNVNSKGSLTLSERGRDFFFDVNIEFDFLSAHLEVMSLSLTPNTDESLKSSVTTNTHL